MTELNISQFPVNHEELGFVLYAQKRVKVRDFPAPHVNPETLWNVAKTMYLHPEILEAIVQHEGTPMELLEWVAIPQNTEGTLSSMSRNYLALNVAHKSLKLQQNLLDWRDLYTDLRLLDNQEIHPEVLEVIYKLRRVHGKSDTNNKIFGHKKCTKVMQMALMPLCYEHVVRSMEDAVGEYAISCPRVYYSVAAEWAATQGHVPQKLLLLLLNSGYVPKGFAKKYIQHPSYKVRRAAREYLHDAEVGDVGWTDKIRDFCHYRLNVSI